MSKNSKGFCSACLRDQLRCNRGKPKCDKCNERGTKCSYSFKLKWGGRQYKDANRLPGIPNTKFHKGALLVKDKRMIVRGRTPKVRQFLQIGQEDVEAPLSFYEKRRRIEGDKKHNQLQLPVIDNSTPTPPPSPFRDVVPLVQPVALQTPGVTDLELNADSWEVSTLFNLFVNETSKFFVAFNSQAYPNPYRTILPRMALNCPTLMKLIVAFGAKHRKMIAVSDEETSCPSLEEESSLSKDFEYMGENLLNQALEELMAKLQNSGSSVDDSTVAIILLLSSLGIFFNDDRGDWRTHYNGAKRIVFNKLEMNEESKDPLVYYRKEQQPHFFVMRWFIYLDVVGPLSSGSFYSKSEEVPRPQLDFKLAHKLHLDRNSMLSLDDINPLSGMDMNLLSYLTRVSQLVLQKETCSAQQDDYFKTVGEAICLDYKISNYLRESETQRDAIVQKLEVLTDPLMDIRLENYKLLRSTNLIVGLTAILQLRRRVVEMAQDSELVKQLVLKITDLVREKISINSPALSCMSFCFFTVGSELVNESMSVHRNIYCNRLMSLWRKGLPSVLQALYIMGECWNLKKPWWVVLEEKDLDICFAF